MPGGNAEIAREGLRRWSEGDIDGALALMQPEIEWHLVFELPDLPTGKTVYRGHDEVRQVWDAFRSVWETITVEVEEVLRDEGGTVVARARFEGRAAGSGIEVGRTVFYVFDVDHGRLARIRPFDRADEAIRAAVGT